MTKFMIMAKEISVETAPVVFYKKSFVVIQAEKARPPRKPPRMNAEFGECVTIIDSD